MGTYDTVQHTFDYSGVYSLDDGLDFYAPQTMLAQDGRRIMIGWMQSWDSNIRPAEQKWACMMTLPRELRIENGRILQSPVHEIETYWNETVRYEGIAIIGDCQLKVMPNRQEIMEMIANRKEC